MVLYKRLHETLAIYKTNDTSMITLKSINFYENEQIGQTVKEVTKRNI